MPAGADTRFNLWNNYVIEADWDFGFLEVSTDGGTTWAEQKVYTGADVEVSTPDGYADPNGRMHDYGDKKYGLTGDSHGWRLDYVKLAPFAGQNIKLRLRLRDRRSVPGARLVRRRLLDHLGRRDRLE